MPLPPVGVKLASTLTAFGVAVGSQPRIVGATRHTARIFSVLVGATAKGRKGDSLAVVKAFFNRAMPEFDERIAGGLASGEGIIWAIRDKMMSRMPRRERGRVVEYEEIESDAGVTDKR
jgi:hypothetical protein